MAKLKNHGEFIIEQLQDKEFRNEFVESLFKDYHDDSDEKSLLLGLRYVADAEGGLGELAKKSSLSREYLYKIFNSQRVPKFPTFFVILRSLGIKKIYT
jgi:probable addiction module antidote protein